MVFSLLIVEDDKAACDIIARMVGLEFPDCTIYTAENGLKGLEIFQERTPDVVITDVNMPVMDGIEFATQIRSTNANATYIVLTAHNDQTILEKFKQMGFCAYLLKPIDFNELFAAIERCSVENKLQ
jgi:YesN/AraC family two-component response regulator